MNEIIYRREIPLTDDIIELYKSSGINRPIEDHDRIELMYKNSNLVVTARDGDRLVGVVRSLTDLCYCCYLSDLAVRADYQRLGIGSELIRQTKHHIGDQTTLLLLSAPGAMDYYPKVGFEEVSNGYIIHRKH
ncbi:MAG: GNAT family N-acetyltransferase [Saprospiraceae bacterium]|nr:GNAT family N-acetyltransferase [Saprospiraceae bacterium]